MNSSQHSMAPQSLLCTGHTLPFATLLTVLTLLRLIRHLPPAMRTLLPPHPPPSPIGGAVLCRSSSPSICHTSDGTHPVAPDPASSACDEDTASARPSTLFLLTEQFCVVATARACDLVEPAHSSRFVSPLQCLQMRGSSCWQLAVPISSLEQTLDGLHYPALLRYLLCMQMFPEHANCLCSWDTMDIWGAHALLCSRQDTSAGFQLCHRLVQQTLGTLLR